MGGYVSRTQVIRCHCCGERGIIARSEFFDGGRGEMIVRCSNPECGHVWVMVSEYSHTLKHSQLPPREDVHQCGN
ncbi:hypothetical protein AA232_002442 [Salmonella enterica subsp. enterica serovar Wentworth]|nr:hypothetical protein [Salmonella enterica subsp. enterica serovar Wentworth]